MTHGVLATGKLNGRIFRYKAAGWTLTAGDGEVAGVTGSLQVWWW